jgi:chromosome segregation ATPase
MKRIVLCMAVVGISAGFLSSGCTDATSARVEVAKEAALKKLDGFLGSLDVKRKEIDLAVKRLKEATNEITKQKIKAQVKVDQIDSKSQPVRDRMAKADSSLKRFRELIKADSPAEIGGKTYSLDEIKAMATKVIEARQGYGSQITSIEQSQAGLKKIIINLEKRRNDLQSKITYLEADLTNIDTQAASAKAMKEASAAIGDSGASLDQNIAMLEDTIADLMAETQGELALEGEKWDSAATDNEIDSVDSIIARTQEHSDTLSEIDKILGNTTSIVTEQL